MTGNNPATAYSGLAKDAICAGFTNATGYPCTSVTLTDSKKKSVKTVYSISCVFLVAVSSSQLQAALAAISGVDPAALTAAVNAQLANVDPSLAITGVSAPVVAVLPPAGTSNTYTYSTTPTQSPGSASVAPSSVTISITPSVAPSSVTASVSPSFGAPAASSPAAGTSVVPISPSVGASISASSTAAVSPSRKKGPTGSAIYLSPLFATLCALFVPFLL